MSRNAKRERRASAPSEKGSEKLKGRIRELAKEVDKWKRYALSLEKYLQYSPEKLEQLKASKKIKKEQKVKEVDAKGDACESCGSHNTEKVELWTPTGTRLIVNCKECPHKKRL